jgi:methionyl-tRNA synthetase
MADHQTSDELSPSTESLYLTTPIYYVNDAPHIGHAYTTVISDAVARWNRLLGRQVRFVTGTDEHGLKIQRAAQANGMSARQWADRTVERFQQAWQHLGISYDDFIRTTEHRHYKAVSDLLLRVRERGYIRSGTYSGLYCAACEAYYTEDETSDGKCGIHQSQLEFVSEPNYFFELSRLQQDLIDWYERHPDFVRPSAKRREALGFISQGLADFSISRTSLTWGIPIPWDPAHVTYVWFDALTNYITAAGYGQDEESFRHWWPSSIHVIGKDILRFHCVYWPAMLLAAGLTPPRQIFVHGFLLVGGEKMSKTRLNNIAPADLVGDFGVDGLRYHLIRDVPFGPDGEFSYERMVDRYNTDLANNLGNLAARVAAVVAKKCAGTGPTPTMSSPLRIVAGAVYREAAAAWDELQPSKALAATWRLLREANSHLELHEPWRMRPGPDVDAVLGDALEALRITAILASPALPNACDLLWKRLGLPGSPSAQRLPEAAQWGGYPGGVPVTSASALFPRLAGEQSRR